MELYQCRGRITAISSNGTNFFITIEANTQFDCKKNRLKKISTNSSFDTTVLNILIEVHQPDTDQPVYQLKEPLDALALPADCQIIVGDTFLGKYDDFDIDPEYEWTFIIEKAQNSKNYELKYIQLGPHGDNG